METSANSGLSKPSGFFNFGSSSKAIEKALRTQISTLEATITDLKQTIAELTVAHGTQIRVKASLDDELERQGAANSALTERLTHVSQTLTAAEARGLAAAEESARARAELTQSSLAHAAEVQQLQNTNESLVAQLAQLRQDLAVQHIAAMEEKQRLQAENAALQVQRDELQIRYHVLSEQVAANDAAVALIDSTADIETLSPELQLEIKRLRAAYQRTISAFQQTTDQNAAQIFDEQERRRQLESEVAEKADTITKLLAVNACLRNAIEVPVSDELIKIDRKKQIENSSYVLVQRNQLDELKRRYINLGAVSGVMIQQELIEFSALQENTTSIWVAANALATLKKAYNELYHQQLEEIRRRRNPGSAEIASAMPVVNIESAQEVQQLREELQTLQAQLMEARAKIVASQVSTVDTVISMQPPPPPPLPPSSLLGIAALLSESQPRTTAVTSEKRVLLGQIKNFSAGNLRQTKTVDNTAKQLTSEGVIDVAQSPAADVLSSAQLKKVDAIKGVSPVEDSRASILSAIRKRGQEQDRSVVPIKRQFTADMFYHARRLASELAEQPDKDKQEKLAALKDCLAVDLTAAMKAEARDDKLIQLLQTWRQDIKTLQSFRVQPKNAAPNLQRALHVAIQAKFRNSNSASSVSDGELDSDAEVSIKPSAMSAVFPTVEEDPDETIAFSSANAAMISKDKVNPLSSIRKGPPTKPKPTFFQQDSVVSVTPSSERKPLTRQRLFS